MLSFLGFFKSKIVVLVAVLLLGLGGGILLMRVETPNSAIHSSALLTAVKNANEMVTLRAYFREVADKTTGNSSVLGGLIPLPGTWRKLLVVFTGQIICQFDMSKAEVKANEKELSAHIKLPVCELKPDVNIIASKGGNSITDYEETGFWAAKATHAERDQLIQEATDEMMKKAEDEWKLREKAKTNARQVLENFVGAFGYKVEISFADD